MQCKDVFSPGAVSVVHVQVNFPPGQECTIGDRQLQLLQFHFHAPSEHSVNGRRGSMEVHLVHKDKSTGAVHKNIY